MSEEASAEQGAKAPADEPRGRHSPMAHDLSRRLRAQRARAAQAPSSWTAGRHGPWRSVLDGELARSARSTVLEIAEALRAPSDPAYVAPPVPPLPFPYLAASHLPPPCA